MAADERKDICPVCEIVVNDDEDGIICDGFCERWHHASCVDVSSDNYNKISEVASFMKWFCSVCAGKVETMRSQVIGAEDYTNLHGMIGSLIKAVKGVIDDNNAINVKIDTISIDHCRLSDELKTVSQSISNCQRSMVDRSKSAADTNTDAIEEPNEPSEAKHNTSAVGSENSSPSAIDSKDFPQLSSSRAERRNRWTEVVYRKNKQRTSIPANQKVISKSAENLHSPNLDKNQQSRGSRQLAAADDKNSTSSTKQKYLTDRSRSDQTVKRTKSNLSSRQIVVGTNEKSDNLAGDKKAWFYLGRVKKDTDVETVKKYITNQFPGINVFVSKLDNKGVNDSFKVGVDYDRKDDLMSESVWPKNVQIKRFLFRRTSSAAVG